MLKTVSGNVQEMVRRYRELFYPVACKANAYKQEGYRPGERNAWAYLRRSPTDREWHRHLDWTDEFWLGWPCPRNAQDACATEHIVFDIDAKTAADAGQAAETVHRITGEFGPAWFIARTPSHGYHVYHRLDRRCEVDRLMTGEKVGLVADALRAAGIDVGREHKVEVYPQPRRCLRGPLGTRQPLVDPVTLIDLDIDHVADAISYVEGRRDQ